jgi:hypothetical protein
MKKIIFTLAMGVLGVASFYAFDAVKPYSPAAYLWASIAAGSFALFGWGTYKILSSDPV